jgi:hypothetical protein
MIGTPLPIETFGQSVVLDNLVDNSMRQNESSWDGWYW